MTRRPETHGSVTRPVDVPDELFERMLTGGGLTRREVLRFCEIAGISATFVACGGGSSGSLDTVAKSTTTTSTAPVATTPSTTPAAAPAPAPTPRTSVSERVRPFDLGGTERVYVAGLNSVADATGDKDSGHLWVTADAVMSGTAQGAAATGSAWVRWVYMHPTGAPTVRAAPQLTFALAPGDGGTMANPDSGAGSWLVVLFSRVTDTTTGNEVVLPVQRVGSVQVLSAPVTLEQDHAFDQTCGLLFEAAHTYNIEALLMVRADVFSAAGMEVNPQHLQMGGSGESWKEYAVDVQKIGLVTMEPPWVRTLVKAMFEPTRDTFDVYEQAVSETTGRGYFQAGVQMEVAAGGAFDPARSSITVTSSEGPIVQLRGLTLQHTIAADGLSAQIDLPSPAQMPLAGQTWRFVTVIDPEFITPADRVDYTAPVFRPWLDMMLDVDLAARQTLVAKQGFAGARQVPSPTRGLTVSANDLFDPSHWCIVMPESRFRSLALAVEPRELPEFAVAMPVVVYVPQGVEPPKLDYPTLKVSVEDLPSWSPEAWQYSTEPLVVLTVLDLWNQLYWTVVQPAAEERGLSVCANPTFVQFLQSVGDRSESYRQYLDSLYYMSPRSEGPAIKLTDLPESLAAGRQSGGPLYVSIGGELIPLVVFLSRRLRRFIRHVIVLDTLQSLWAQVRPTQQHQITVSGLVANATQQDDDYDYRRYTVLMDFVPALQPWSLQEPTVF